MIADTIEIAGQRFRIVRRLPIVYEDLRPGREGRRASKALLNELNVEQLHELFKYDPETGKLYWRTSSAYNVKADSEAGYVQKEKWTNYRRVTIARVGYQVHTIVWAMAYGWPECDLDHRDGNGLNNRLENLRPATRKENGRNRRARLTCSSTYKGVQRDKRGKWRTFIQGFHIGYFTLECEAAKAYDAAAKLLYGEFARMNFNASESEHTVLSGRVLRRIMENTRNG
jgi:hypothetical protein